VVGSPAGPQPKGSGLSLEIRPLREDERDRIYALQTQAFNVPRSEMKKMPSWPADVGRGAFVDGELVAMLKTYTFGHYFGGRVVPALGIGGVSVAAHARGGRVAETLMMETLREFHERGVPISTLYPATVPLYRRCGYEYAGYRIVYRARLDALPREAGLAVEPWDEEDLDDVVACYRTWAATQNGVVDRPEWFWRDRVLRAGEDEAVYRYCVREDGRVTGYTIYSQEKHGDLPWGFDLATRDFVWTTPASGRALIGLAGRHRSTGVDLLWTGGAGDALSLLLPEQDANHDFSFRQMIRMLDVPTALEARGYPPELEAAVELQVSDDAFGWNDAGWRISCTGGTAKVSSAPGAMARVDAAILGSIFTGMVSATAARVAGRLRASDEEVAILEAMFAGPPPYINDWF
jgi:predicted acetyltransferase